MKKLAVLLVAFVALAALSMSAFAADAKPKPADVETYRTEAGQHVFTIKGQEYKVPITADFDYATAQSACRKVAKDVANGVKIDSVPPPIQYYFTPAPSCPNGQCPYAQPPRR